LTEIRTYNDLEIKHKLILKLVRKHVEEGKTVVLMDEKLSKKTLEALKSLYQGEFFVLEKSEKTEELYKQIADMKRRSVKVVYCNRELGRGVDFLVHV